LKATLRKYRNRAIETARVIEELIALAKEIWQAGHRGEDLGLTEEETAFYDVLETNDSAVKARGDQNLRFIAQELVKTIRENVNYRLDRKAARARKTPRHGQAGPA
jgi:type I restriction enzyme, R subunit